MSQSTMVSQWDVTIPADGLSLAGRLFVPVGLGPEDRCPAVAVAGPVPAVKEIASPGYAAALAAAGFITLTFDYRGFGASEGARREGGVVNEQADDLRFALDYLAGRRDVEPGRLAVCGIGIGAAYACMVAAFDPRVRACASVGAVLDFRAAVGSMLGPQPAAAYLADLTRRAEGKRPEASYIPVVGTRAPLVMLPGEAAFRFFDRAGRTQAGRWRNRVSVQLLARLLDFQALPFLPQLAQRPTLFVQGSGDALSPAARASRLLEFGSEAWTVEIVWTHHHFELYDATPAGLEAAALVAGWTARTLRRTHGSSRGPRVIGAPARGHRSPAADRTGLPKEGTRLY
jgi:pimeloyl-ACP methyl ester carboxylesterase